MPYKQCADNARTFPVCLTTLDCKKIFQTPKMFDITRVLMMLAAFFTLERQLATGFLLVAIALSSAFVVSTHNTRQLITTTQLEAHSREVMQSLEAVLALMVDSETGVRGYLLTGKASYLGPDDRARDQIPQLLQHLQSLIADNPRQSEQLRILSPDILSLLTQRSELMAQAKRGRPGMTRWIRILDANKAWMDHIRLEIARMQQEESRLLKLRQDAFLLYNQRADLTLNLLRALMLVVLLGAYLVSHRHLARRRAAEQATRQLNAQLETRVQERTAALASSNVALRDSEARLQTTLESLSEGVVVSDLAGHVLHFNRAALAMHGLASLEECQRQLPEFMALFELSSQENTPLPLEHWPLARILRGETLQHWEIKVRHRVQEWQRQFSYSGALARDPEGQPLLAVVTVSDVTERKLAESRARQQLEYLNLLDTITRLIGERFDLQSIFQLVIRSLEDHLPVDFGCVLLQEPSRQTLRVAHVGMKWAASSNLAEGTLIDVDHNGLGQCLAGQLVYEPDIRTSRFPFPTQLVRHGMQALVLAPLRAESQVFGALVAAKTEARSFSSIECEFLRQLSEHVALAARQAELHQALQQAYDELRDTQQVVMQQERLRALGEMASGIAHDINNALSPVLLYTESLLEGEGQADTRLLPKTRRYLETIQRAVEDVTLTVSRLREFYRPHDHQVELASLNLNPLVAQVLDLTRARWRDMPQEHGILIQPVLDLAQDLPDILGIEGELREALTNLVLNAVDAMPQGGVLTLRSRQTPGAGSPAQVIIEVVDDGIGMDDATQQRCLQPFFTTKGERGTGLGLAMVFGTVQRHGGDLEIESTPGAGTTVRLLFPAQRSSGGRPAPPESETQPLSPRRILLVDDDPVLLKSLRDILEADGHRVTAVSGGEEGQRTFREMLATGQPPDVVITDLGMPQVDGRAVAAAVKASSPTTPVILLTGWGRRLITENDIPPHVDHVLAKPPKLQSLRAALRQLCTSPRAAP